MKNKIILCLLLTCLNATAQSDYAARIKEAAGLLPAKATQADSIGRMILDEIREDQKSNDSLFILTYFILGTSNLYQGKLNLALDFFEKSLKRNQKNILPTKKLACLVNSAIIYEKQSRFNEALETYQKALQHAEERKDTLSMPGIWMNIGILSHRLKDDEKAIDLMNKSYAFYAAIRDTLGMANALQNHAICLYPSRSQEAEVYLRRALELYKLDKNPYRTAVSKCNLAELLIFQKKYDKATSLLKENIKLCQNSGLNEPLSICYRLLARSQIEEGVNLDSALYYLEKSSEIALKTGRSDLVKLCKETELLFQVRLGNFERVVKILEEYDKLNDETDQEHARITNSEFQTIYEVEKIAQQKNLLQEGFNLKRKQLLLTVVALLAALLAILVIVLQYLRLRRAMETMYRMNVEIVKISNTGQTNMDDSESETENFEDTTNEDNIPLINLYNAILSRISTNKLYLDPNLSLQGLGENMNRSTRYLSQALSEVGKTTFPSLINNFRVNEARRLFASEQNLSIHEIMEKSGFGRRQAFHRNFKAITGFTPAEYQERASKNN